jgi:hypothetical protein
MSAPMFVAVDEATWVQVDKIITVTQGRAWGEDFPARAYLQVEGLGYAVELPKGITAKDFLNRIESAR